MCSIFGGITQFQLIKEILSIGRAHPTFIGWAHPTLDVATDLNWAAIVEADAEVIEKPATPSGSTMLLNP